MCTWSVFLLSIMLASTALAQPAQPPKSIFADDQITEEELKVRTDLDLWNQCHPIGLIVGYKPASYTTTYPSQKSIHDTLISKLRAAHIYRERHFAPSLSVHVEAMQDGIVNTPLRDLALISFAYNKEVFDLRSGTMQIATSWQHYGWSGVGRLHETLAEIMDLFITQYLSENASACKQTEAPKTDKPKP